MLGHGLAGRLFLSGAIRPAPQPAVYDVSGRTIFGFDGYNGIGMNRNTFSRGAKIRFRPDDATDVTVDGAPLAKAEPATGAVLAGDQIAWDWPNGRLIIDTPTFKAYVGRVAGTYQFRDGVALSDVTVPWVAFAAASGDGKPLVGAEATSLIEISAVFDAKNSGFRIDPNFKGGDPYSTADAIHDVGHAPVVVDRVGYTLSLPTEFAGRFEGYDFALRKVSDRPLSPSSTFVCEPSELLVGMLHIDRRGQPAQPPATTLAIADSPESSKSGGPGPSVASTPTVADDLWNPIPGLRWKMTYAEAHRALSEGKRVHGTLSRPDSAGRTIEVTDVELAPDAPADAVLSFEAGQLRKIDVTFKRPPALVVVIADYEKRFGLPAEKSLKRQEELSRIRWHYVRGNQALDVVMTEAQGTLRIAFDLPAGR